MFQLKSILLQESRSESLTFSEIKELYKKNCQKHMPASQEIYRGTSSTYDYGFIDPSNYVRRSSGDVGNHYTLLIDNLPEWSQYPKRSRSVICSMDDGKALQYGNPFVVIPYDNKKVGISPKDDIWYSFKTGLSEHLGFLNAPSLPAFNMVLDLLYIFLKGADEDVTGLDDSDFSTFWKQIGEISKNSDVILRNMKRFKVDKDYRTKFALSGKYNEIFNSTFESVKTLNEKDIDLKRRIRKGFDPDTNGFEVEEYGGAFYTDKNDNEVWTSGPCLLIAKDKYKPFLQKVKR